MNNFSNNFIIYYLKFSKHLSTHGESKIKPQVDKCFSTWTSFYTHSIYIVFFFSSQSLKHSYCFVFFFALHARLYKVFVQGTRKGEKWYKVT